MEKKKERTEVVYISKCKYRYFVLACFVQIRTAVVFTLGTFLSSNKVERTDQSNTIDQNVGNTLCSLVHDGSHLVREVSRTLFTLHFLGSNFYNPCQCPNKTSGIENASFRHFLATRIQQCMIKVGNFVAH